MNPSQVLINTYPLMNIDIFITSLSSLCAKFLVGLREVARGFSLYNNGPMLANHEGLQINNVHLFEGLT